jgi:ethanolamine utilization protein EutN
MIVAKVVGTVWATQKQQSLTGHRLLVVQPLDADEKPAGSLIVAVDALGAGMGQQVLVSLGSAAQRGTPQADSPIDAAVVALVDKLEVDKRHLG